MSYGAPQWQQPPPAGGWPMPPVAQPGPVFDPRDPLVSADYGGWWRRGVATLRRGWRQIALLQLLAAAPAALIVVPAQIYQVRRQVEFTAAAATGGPPDFGALFAGLGVLMLALIPVSLISLFVGLAILRLTATIATGGPASVSAALRAALSRLAAGIGWQLVAAVIGLVALVLCVLPVIYVGAVFALLPAVVIFERTNPIARCFQLFHADLGSAIARIATLAGIGFGISLVFGVPNAVLQAVVRAAAPGAGEVVFALVSAPVEALEVLAAGTLIGPMLLFTYADLRARREPFSGMQLAATTPA
jgi:hypothetical protein